MTHIANALMKKMLPLIVEVKDSCEKFLVQQILVSIQLVFQIPIYANQEVFWSFPSFFFLFSVNTNLTAQTTQQQNMQLNYRISLKAWINMPANGIEIESVLLLV